MMDKKKMLEQLQKERIAKQESMEYGKFVANQEFIDSTTNKIMFKDIQRMVKFLFIFNFYNILNFPISIYRWTMQKLHRQTILMKNVKGSRNRIMAK